MADINIIAFDVASFICALFVLEFGADKFIDHTAIMARRTGISQVLIGLLTAGAEWEELVVVVAFLARNRPSLAIGNIVGSTIANILGAFSLGLLCNSSGERMVFDRSSRIYSLLLLFLNIFTCLLFLFGTRSSSSRTSRTVFGAILVVSFVAYVVSVSYAISRGAITAPELSDSDDDDDDDDTDDDDDSDNDSEAGLLSNGDSDRRRITSRVHKVATAAVPEGSSVECRSQKRSVPHRRHHLIYHIGFLLLGFISICLSGYVLSEASTTICDQLGISDVFFGVVILSVATTLPEKFIAVISGARGQAGILVANTVGSNIFLLTLCMGIFFLVTTAEIGGSSINLFELGAMMVSTVVLTAVVWFGANWSRWIGGIMLLAYIGFIVLEVVLSRKS